MEADIAFCFRVLCFVAICVGCVGAGLLLWAARHTRHRFVEAYAATVQRWQSQVHDQFADAAFNLTLFWGASDERHSVRLSRTDAIERPSLRARVQELPSYQPLRHEQFHQLAADWSPGHAAQQHLHLRLQGCTPSTEACCTPDALAGGSGLPVAFVEERPWSLPPAHCAERLGGSFHSATRSCVTFHALDVLCIKVAYDVASGCWRPDDRGGGYGCEPGEDGLWPLGVYRQISAVRSPAGRAFYRDAPSQLPAAVLRVRHSLDPRVQAANLTAGTYDFGAPDSLKVYGGVELLIVAASLLTPAMLYFMRRAGLRAGHCAADHACGDGWQGWCRGCWGGLCAVCDHLFGCVEHPVLSEELWTLRDEESRAAAPAQRVGARWRTFGARDRRQQVVSLELAAI